MRNTALSGMARAFLEEAVAHLPESMRHVTLAGAGPAAIAPAHAQAGTMPAIRAALAFIPNAELDYDSWVRIGLALKGALGDAGEELFAFWSAVIGLLVLLFFHVVLHRPIVRVELIGYP